MVGGDAFGGLIILVIAFLGSVVVVISSLVLSIIWWRSGKTTGARALALVALTITVAWISLYIRFAPKPLEDYEVNVELPLNGPLSLPGGTSHTFDRIFTSHQIRGHLHVSIRFPDGKVVSGKAKNLSFVLKENKVTKISLSYTPDNTESVIAYWSDSGKPSRYSSADHPMILRDGYSVDIVTYNEPFHFRFEFPPNPAVTR